MYSSHAPGEGNLFVLEKSVWLVMLQLSFQGFLSYLFHFLTFISSDISVLFSFLSGQMTSPSSALRHWEFLLGLRIGFYCVWGRFSENTVMQGLTIIKSHLFSALMWSFCGDFTCYYEDYLSPSVFFLLEVSKHVHACIRDSHVYLCSWNFKTTVNMILRTLHL